MRPVDYRAWDTAERKMIYDFSNFAGWQARHEMEDSWKHDRYIKMQFTGLLDNSTPPKKIYEGDIVRWWWDIHWGPYAVVSMGELDDCNDNKIIAWIAEDCGINSKCVVCGNIFENHELLENNNGIDT